MKKFLLSFLCFLLAVAGGYAVEVKDVLNRTTTGITNTTYASWTAKGLNSAAVYVGQSAGGNSSIQLRSDKSTSGIITNTSGGKVMKIVVEWNSSTSSGRTLDVYGKNTAYSNPADLYSSSTQGTKLGSIKYGTSTELVITGDYEYIGLRSNSGAMYLSSIEITWENGETGGEETPVAPSAPTLTPSCSFYYTMDVGITNIPDGSTIYYTTDGTEPTTSDGTEYTEPFEITATTTVKAIAVKDGLSSDVVTATYTKIEVPEGQVIDVLNRDLTGNTTTGYSEWSGKTSNSSAVYAGNSAGGNESIQLRSNNSNSGIVSTQTAGKVRKVTVVWNSSTSNGRTLNVYGKNTAYTSSTDLYSDSKWGTLLGTIVYGTSTELSIDGDYAYIGLRSNSGAMYLISVSITWDTSASVEPETPVAPNAPTLTASCNFDDAMNVVITNISEGATVYYTTDGSTPSASNSTVYSKPFEITATTTVNAIAVNDGGSSEVVTATYTKNQVFDSGVTDILTPETTGVESGSTIYTDWSGKKSNSSAVYAGQSASKDGTIQLRSKNSNSGIVSTTSGGKVRKITVEWNSQTTENQVLQIYGNNSPYTSAAELYDTNNNTNQGKLLGEIVCGESTIFVVEENYAYVGLRSKNGAIYLNSVEITWEEDVWGSLYYPTDVEIPTSVKAYIVTAANNNYVTLTQVTGALPANTGIIYNGKWTEKGSAVSDEANVEGNLLKGSLSNTYVEEDAYVLAKVDGEVGFYKAAMNQLDGTAFLNNANKAYLPASELPASVQNAKALKFDFNTTAVENIKVETEGKKVIYDLSGRRVNDMTAPGLYIVNGKKVMVK